MKMTSIKKNLPLFLCFVLIAVMALFTTGCSDNRETPETPDENSSEISSQAIEDSVTEESESAIEVGEGNTKFTFTVTHNDGTKKTFIVSTDKTKVGEALVDNGIIAGEDGPYGLYVKTVDSETLDYDKDGKYWAFYIDGAYGATGVDMTDITAGSSYEFRAE
jgi:hypothetical protein